MPFSLCINMFWLEPNTKNISRGEDCLSNLGHYFSSFLFLVFKILTFLIILSRPLAY